MSAPAPKVKNWKAGLGYILGSAFVFVTGLIFIFVLAKGNDFAKVYFWIGIVMCVLSGISFLFGMVMTFIGFKPKGGKPLKP